MSESNELQSTITIKGTGTLQALKACMSSIVVGALTVEQTALMAHDVVTAGREAVKYAKQQLTDV